MHETVINDDKVESEQGCKLIRREKMIKKETNASISLKMEINGLF